MIKSFYKKSHYVSTFFKKGLKVRSTAYGKLVLNELLAWYDAYSYDWNSRTGNVMLCEHGNISGNSVRSGGVKAVLPSNGCNPRETFSVLTPLLWNDSLYEVDKQGFVYINGNKSMLNIGTEIKAWAITACVSGKRLTNGYLAVIAKPIGVSQMGLALYEISSVNTQPKTAAWADMPVTLGAKSYIVCFGRHIFTVHESKLDYFYFTPDCELERCAIGNDGDNSEFAWCSYVYPDVVCDERGNVYWAAGDSIYGFPIGSPRNLTLIDDICGKEFVKLQCFADSLYVYVKDNRTAEYECYKYTNGNGQYIKKFFNRGSLNNMFLWIGENSSQYVKIMPTDRGAVAVSAENSGSAEKLAANRYAVNKDAFCSFGELIPSARYAGIDKKNNPIVIK